MTPEHAEAMWESGMRKYLTPTGDLLDGNVGSIVQRTFMVTDSLVAVHYASALHQLNAKVANDATERIRKAKETIEAVGKRLGDQDDDAAKDLKKQGKAIGGPDISRRDFIKQGDVGLAAVPLMPSLPPNTLTRQSTNLTVHLSELVAGLPTGLNLNNVYGTATVQTSLGPQVVEAYSNPEGLLYFNQVSTGYEDPIRWPVPENLEGKLLFLDTTHPTVLNSEQGYTAHLSFFNPFDGTAQIDVYTLLGQRIKEASWEGFLAQGRQDITTYLGGNLAETDYYVTIQTGQGIISEVLHLRGKGGYQTKTTRPSFGGIPGREELEEGWKLTAGKGAGDVEIDLTFQLYGYGTVNRRISIPDGYSDTIEQGMENTPPVLSTTLPQTGAGMGIEYDLTIDDFTNDVDINGICIEDAAGNKRTLDYSVNPGANSRTITFTLPTDLEGGGAYSLLADWQEMNDGNIIRNDVWEYNFIPAASKSVSFTLEDAVTGESYGNMNVYAQNSTLLGTTLSDGSFVFTTTENNGYITIGDGNEVVRTRVEYDISASGATADLGRVTTVDANDFEFEAHLNILRDSGQYKGMIQLFDSMLAAYVNLTGPTHDDTERIRTVVRRLNDQISEQGGYIAIPEPEAANSFVISVGDRSAEEAMVIGVRDGQVVDGIDFSQYNFRGISTSYLGAAGSSSHRDNESPGDLKDAFWRVSNTSIGYALPTTEIGQFLLGRVNDSGQAYWADTIMAGNAVPEIEDGLTSRWTYRGRDMSKELLAHKAFYGLGKGTRLIRDQGLETVVHNYVTQ